MTIKAEAVVDRKAILGEGSIWDSKSGVLWWIDITGKNVFRFDPDSRENTPFDVGQMVGTVVLRASGGIVCALEDQIAVLDPESGRVERLLPLEADVGETRCNDGKCDPAGRFWVGTMGTTKPRRNGSLYCIDKDLKPIVRVSETGTSNGIVWSSDCKTMYYIDTPTSAIDAFDYYLATGEIFNRRHAVEVDKAMGFPDGMTIDENDNVWVAMWAGGCVRCWDPKTARLLETVEIPGAGNVTSCAFGGPDLDTLFITTAQEGLSNEDKPNYPDAGKLFAAKVGVKGVASFEFAG